MQLNIKQQRFIQEYVKDTNATQAAIRTGYSEKTAYSQGQRLLKHDEVKRQITELLEDIRDQNIATAKEVEEFLSLSMKGEIEEEVVVIEGEGDGVSNSRIITKKIGAKDRIKAAELLGKRHSLFTDKVNVSGVQVVFEGENDIEE